MNALLVGALGVGALLYLTRSSSAAVGGTPSPPEGSTPPFQGTPVRNVVKAVSGRVYTVFTWPPNDSGYYSVAVMAASTVWISFYRQGDKSTAVKSNTNDPALLAMLRADWSLGG